MWQLNALLVEWVHASCSMISSAWLPLSSKCNRKYPHSSSCKSEIAQGASLIDGIGGGIHHFPVFPGWFREHQFSLYCSLVEISINSHPTLKSLFRMRSPFYLCACCWIAFAVYTTRARKIVGFRCDFLARAISRVSRLLCTHPKAKTWHEAGLPLLAKLGQ